MQVNANFHTCVHPNLHTHATYKNIYFQAHILNRYFYNILDCVDFEEISQPNIQNTHLEGVAPFF